MRRLMSLRPVETICDVGACRGEVSARLAGLFPAAQVHAFEPHPESFATLETNTAGSPRIHRYNLALGATPGKTTLHLNAVAGSSSLLERPRTGQRTYHNPSAVHVGQAEVQVDTLDRWAIRAGVATIDLLKLDVQGSELNVLSGAERMLSTVRLVYTEVQYYPTYEGAPLMCDLWVHLRAAGLRLFHCYNSWGGADGQVVQGDAIFVRPGAVAETSDAARGATSLAD